MTTTEPYPLALIFEPSIVNRKISSAQIVSGDAWKHLSASMTAGKSTVLDLPSDALQTYFDETALVEVTDLLSSVHSLIPSRIRPDAVAQSDPSVTDVGAAGEVATFVVGSSEGSTEPHVSQRSTFEDGRDSDPIGRLRQARQATEGARSSAISLLRQQLDSQKAKYSLEAPAELLTRLVADIGVSQLMIATALGVSPTAVRKWQRGEPLRPEHRDRLSQFASLVTAVGEAGDHDPPGWLELPISTDSTLTPLDLFERGRPELVVLFASKLTDPQETLDAFAPDWRDKYPPDRDLEVVQLEDGSRSAVARKGAQI